MHVSVLRIKKKEKILTNTAGLMLPVAAGTPLLSARPLRGPPRRLQRPRPRSAPSPAPTAPACGSPRSTWRWRRRHTHTQVASLYVSKYTTDWINYYTCNTQIMSALVRYINLSIGKAWSSKSCSVMANSSKMKTLFSMLWIKTLQF